MEQLLAAVLAESSASPMHSCPERGNILLGLSLLGCNALLCHFWAICAQEGDLFLNTLVRDPSPP